MKAVGYRNPGPIDRDDALVDVELPTPVPTGRDLLVHVQAVSVNPVDTQVRASTKPSDGDDWKVLGYDAAGTVAATGPDATLFEVGDEVWYAGTVTRPGTYAEHHLIDERIVGAKPRTLDWAEAAALPLTTLAAWEMLFDRLDIRRPVPGAANAILIVGGAGGVGSIATQLARRLTEVTVITTASRPETVQWSQDMGAHHVLNHRQPLAPQVAALGLGAPAFVFSTTQTNAHAADLAELIAPQGRFGLIDRLADANLFMMKSVSIHWEAMFTRPIFDTTDVEEQGRLLTEVARLVDEGILRTTLTERRSPINAATLKAAHVLVESGTARGKVTIEGFGTSRPFG